MGSQPDFGSIPARRGGFLEVDKNDEFSIYIAMIRGALSCI